MPQAIGGTLPLAFASKTIIASEGTISEQSTQTRLR
jgi:hypothetical protein